MGQISADAEANRLRSHGCVGVPGTFPAFSATRVPQSEKKIGAQALKARCEKVRILYHGRVKGEIPPFKDKSSVKTAEHPIFGMRKGEKGNPEEIVSKMRSGRYNDI